MEGSGCLIKGLSIVNFGGSGILLAGDFNTVTDSYLGVRADGMSVGGNGNDGVDVTGAGNTIGSPNVVDDMGNLTTSSQSNIIANNGMNGPESGRDQDRGSGGDRQPGRGQLPGASTASRTTVRRTRACRTRAAINDGVQIDGASFNTIGGPTSADRNVISGNGIGGDNNPNNEAGVEIDQAQARGNLVEGNYIGLDDIGRGHPAESGRWRTARRTAGQHDRGQRHLGQ